jgi:hypothetical protein
VNGASDVFVEIFGERGRHARMAVGVAALPYDVAVEVEGVFEVHGRIARVSAQRQRCAYNSAGLGGALDCELSAEGFDAVGEPPDP